MPRVVIDNVVVTNYINISEISDSLSNAGNNFTIEILGYPVTNKLNAVRVEVYDDQGDLAAIGTGVPTVKVGLRPITTYNCVDYSKALNRKRINQQYSGALQGIIEQAIIDGNASMYFAGVTFFSDSTTPDVVINQNISYLLLKDALSAILLAAGKQLTYKIPIDDNRIYIYEPGFAPLAPIPILNVDSLYTCARQGVRDISYSKIKPLASVIRVFGLNSRQLYNSTTGMITEINPDILRYRAQESRTQYPLSQTANELLLIKVTTPEPQPGGECNVAVLLGGSNYTTYDTYDQSDYSLPTDLVENEMTLEFSASEATLIYTATILGVKENSSISFYLNGSFNGVDSSIIISVNGATVYTVDPSDVQGQTEVISLFDYTNQDIEVVATVNIPEQSGTCIDYYGLLCPTTEIQQLWLDAHCCNINTIVGTGTQGFNTDNLEPLSTDINSVSCLMKNSDDELIFADSLNYRVRKVTTLNIVTTIGGTGNNTTTPTNGVATDQDFGEIEGLFVFSNEVYITLINWGQVGKITTDGNYEIIETIADSGNALAGIVVDSTGIIYVADSGRNLILKIDSGVSIYAGIEFDSTATGDGGLATSATIGQPYALALDSNDNLYFTDINNSLVRMITKSTGIISLIAGGGTSKTFNDLATDWELSFPTGLTVDINNNIYLFDSGLNYVFIIDSNGLINKYAGIGLSGFDGDLGSPLTAVLNGSFNFGGGLYNEVISDSENNAIAIYLSDQANQRIRRITCEPNPRPTGDSCLLMTWTASGVLSEINSSSDTGKGFEIDVAALSASATGEFICNLEIPENYFHYRLRHTIRYNVTTDPGSDLTLGHLRVYINDNLAISYALSFGDGAADELNSTGIADLVGFDLTQYIGQTIEIKYLYDNSTYNPSSGVASGYYEVSPIRVCYKRIDLQTIMGSEIAYDAKYQLTLFNDPLGSPSNNISSDSKMMTLKNPDTQLGEFFLLNMAKGILGTTDGLRILQNGSLIGEFTSADFEALDTQVKVLFLDESLYGQTVEFTAELTSTDYNSFYEITLIFG